MGVSEELNLWFLIFEIVEDLLYNPVFNALRSRDQQLGGGTEYVKYFDEEVSPFAGFETGYSSGFSDLHQLLPAGRGILYATPEQIAEPAGWKFNVVVEGAQFVFPKDQQAAKPAIEPVALDLSHVDEMVKLAALTKPGPFNTRTIKFGHYHGIFHEGRLVAMTGQRLHINDHTEISAVCTHPEHLGKGYAAALILHQLHIILSANEQPFLHVRADNDRAIALYERLGFKKNRGMNFYFMKRK